jgi:multiple sugar transport system permease protein
MASIDVSSPQSSGTLQKKQGRAMSDRWFSVILILPAMIIIGFFALYPLFYAIGISFRFADLTGGGVKEFVGLDNYRTVLFNKFFGIGPHDVVLYLLCRFHRSGLGRFCRLLINGATVGKGLIRSLLILPWRQLRSHRSLLAVSVRYPVRPV